MNTIHKKIIWILSFVLMSTLFLTLPAHQTQAQESAPSWLNPSGMTVETRFPAPAGYFRKADEDPYVDYMRNLPLLPDGSPVLIFNGDLKEDQSAHVAVIDIDVLTYQECSDSAQRLRTEYLYKTKQFDKINYHFSNGMALPWKKWAEGYRVKKEGNKTWLVKTAKPSSSYNNFISYLNMLFTYAGVNSVMKESKKITIADLRPGDSIAATGHLIIVLDVVENEKGQKKFLLAQSYIPAQQIEVLRNPYDNTTPWYDAAYLEQCPFITPEWVYKCPDGVGLYRIP